MNIKKRWLLGIVLLAACSAPAERGITITGEIDGLDAGELIYYAPQADMRNAQTVVAGAGHFRIRIPVAAGQGEWYRIWVGASPLPDNIIMMYLDSGALKITGREGGFKDVKYAGNTAAGEYNAYLQFASESDSLGKIWIDEHPASAMGTALLESYQTSGRIAKDTVVAMIGRRAAAAMNNLPAKRIQEWMRVTADIMPGKPAPVFAMADTAGKSVSLNDFRGKYVLLDFWASWCGPCRAENPNVVKAFNRFKDKGFTVLGVSLDRPGDAAKWLAAVHKDQLQWTHVSDLKYWDNEAAKRYHIQGIPANFLVDPNGVIIARDLRGEQLDKKLAEVLAP